MLMLEPQIESLETLTAQVSTCYSAANSLRNRYHCRGYQLPDGPPVDFPDLHSCPTLGSASHNLDRGRLTYC
jgi:hypothetical protein